MSNSRVLKNKSNQITQGYSNGHRAVDLVGNGKTTDYIIAHSAGTVNFCQTGYKNAKGSTGNASYGNCVKIKHNGGYETLYAHLDSVSVKNGQNVSKGQVIGYMGNTGNSYGAHLHFEVRKDSGRLNPTAYLNADLPDNHTGGKYKYQAYDNVKDKWLPNVTSGGIGYAGNKGNGISGIMIDTLTYQVHDKVKNKWLPWVTGRNGYAGNLPNDIDAVRIKNATYRVYDNVKKKWLPYVTGDSNYAGNIGNSIGGIQIK